METISSLSEQPKIFWNWNAWKNEHPPLTHTDTHTPDNYTPHHLVLSNCDINVGLNISFLNETKKFGWNIDI